MELDYSERDGFQFSGKAQRIQEWCDKKDAEKFEAMCNSLRVLKWQREVLAENGTRLVQLRKRKREWIAKKRSQSLALTTTYNTARRARRLAAHQANPPVRTCQECGSQWCSIRPQSRIGLFCSAACGKRFRHHKRKAVGDE